MRMMCCMALLWAAPAFADVELLLTSEPIGATVTALGYSPGATPVVVKVPTRGKKAPCFRAAALRLTWPSGAQATTPEGMQICESTGKKQTLSFVRPSGVSGAELDYKYALQLQRLELLRRQLSVSTYPGLRQQEQAEYEAQQRRMEEYRQRIQNSFSTEQLRLNCTSQAVGQFIYTNCR